MAVLIFYVLAGIICAAIAAHKGRNAVGWFFVGLFLPLIGIIIILVQSNLKEERARYQHALNERRRLKEELKMERIKSERFRGEARARLDIHDRALGVETEAARGGVLSSPAEAAQIENPGGPPPPPRGRRPRWYYVVDENRQQGPMTFDDLAAAYREERFGDSDLVWRDGWDEWKVVRDDPDLLGRLVS